MAGDLVMWTVYDNPSDFPSHFVARRWLTDRPDDLVLASTSLEKLQETLAQFGLCRMERNPNDDPKILEVWL